MKKTKTKKNTNKIKLLQKGSKIQEQKRRNRGKIDTPQHMTAHFLDLITHLNT